MIYKNIFILRNALGLTQREFAYKLDVVQGTICFLEKGTRKPSIEIGLKMLKLARESGFDIHLEDIFGNKELKIKKF